MFLSQGIRTEELKQLLVGSIPIFTGTHINRSDKNLTLNQRKLYAAECSINPLRLNTTLPGENPLTQYTYRISYQKNFENDLRLRRHCLLASLCVVRLQNLCTICAKTLRSLHRKY
uniref:Uncharacterized protein n=1 Tax=Glossina palpalis gambiensis TaxID=67801 RepID=A0A1B0B3M7_9MUSC